MFSLNQECDIILGEWQPGILNFDSIRNSFVSNYMIMDHTLWSRLFFNTLAGWKGGNFYIYLFTAMLFIVATFLNTVFKGCAVALGYINLGRASIANTDSKLTLSAQQIELIQIEEYFARYKLSKKEEKVIDTWSRICVKINESIAWKLVFNLIVFGGFVFNLSA
jgi:hypothetical protein